MKRNIGKRSFFFLVVTGCILLPSNILAQSLAEEIKTREVFVNLPDSMLRINILVKPGKLKIQPDKTYFWYGSESVMSNRGGYSGYLLHGRYTQFDRKKRLRAEGYYNQGLKDGLWKQWDEHGEMISAINWKHGLKQGESRFYNQRGKLQKTLYYKSDIIEKAEVLNNGKVSKLKYKNGNLALDSKKDKSKKKVKAAKPSADKEKQIAPKPGEAKKQGLFKKVTGIFSAKPGDAAKQPDKEKTKSEQAQKDKKTKEKQQEKPTKIKTDKSQ